MVCKTFIHRFDSDRRLQNPINSKVCGCQLTLRFFVESLLSHRQAKTAQKCGEQKYPQDVETLKKRAHSHREAVQTGTLGEGKTFIHQPIQF